MTNEMQTIVHNLSPAQLTELLREVFRAEIRAELATLIPVGTKPLALPEYPSRRQTKEFLGVSYTTLTNWEEGTNGKPPVLVPYRVGTRVRYRREDVVAALKRGQ